jgi:hypothetical protein
MVDFYDILDQFMCWSEVLPLLILFGFFLFSKKQPPIRWVLLVATAFLGGIYEFTSSYLPEYISLYWYYIFTLFETLGITIFFAPYTNKTWRWGIYIAFCIVTILLFTTTSVEANYYHFGWVCLLELILTLFGVFAWGKKRFQNIDYPSLFHDPDYFVIIGLVFYLSACTLYYILYPLMIQFPNDNALFYWIILPISIMIYGVSLMIGSFRIMNKK